MANVLDGICPDVPLLDFIGQENHWPRSASRKEWLLITRELVASTIANMFKEGPRYGDNPAKPGGEGWLVNDQQQKVVQFKPDASTVHAEWVAVRTYSWVPPNPPVPLTRRRMLRHNAIEAWNTMKKTGWRPCHPPVR